MPSKEDLESLKRQLAAEGRQLDEWSGVGSASSEGCDNTQEGWRIQEELERQSNASSQDRQRLSPCQEGGENRSNSRSNSSSASSRESLGAKNSSRALYRMPQAPGGGTLGGTSASSGLKSSGGGSASATRCHAGSNAGSCGDSSTAAGGTSVDASDDTVCESMTLLQQEWVDEQLWLFMRDHAEQSQTMQLATAASEAKDVQQGEDNAELRAQVAKLWAKVTANENIQELLNTSRGAKIKADGMRDDIKDIIAGMEARQDKKEKRLQLDIEALKAKHAQAQEDAAHRQLKATDLLKEELRVARNECAASRKKGKSSAAERDVLQRNANADAKAHTAELTDTKVLLAVAQQELARRDAVAAAQSNGKVRSTVDNFREQHALEKFLTDLRDSNRLLNNQLSELRLQMLNAQEARADQIGNLQNKIDIAKGGIAQQPNKNGTVARKNRGAPGSKLTSIDEEMDLLDINIQATSAISGQVSSDGAAGVGDLNDFDDEDDGLPARPTMHVPIQANLEEIARLQEELTEAGILNQQLSDDAVEQDAVHSAKVMRLLAQVTQLRNGGALSEEEVDRLKQVGEDASHSHAAKLADAQKALLDMTDARDRNEKSHNAKLEYQAEVHTQIIEDLQEQIAYAVEATRLDSIEIDEAKQLLSATEARHARVVGELNARIQLASSDRLPEEASHEILVQLESAEQKRDVLQKVVEFLPVYWRSQLEQERQKHAADMQPLAAVERQLTEERERARHLEERLARLQEQLAEEP